MVQIIGLEDSIKYNAIGHNDKLNIPNKPNELAMDYYTPWINTSENR